MQAGTTKYEGLVICPKCGTKGKQMIMVRYYYPRTNRFGKRRTYETRVVVHKLEDKKYKVCVIERLNPIVVKKQAKPVNGKG